MSGAEDEETQRLRARVGTTVRGKWRLDALIGAGGMAAVYAATHHVGHRVAIKILHPEGAVSRDHRARFEQEALAATRLGHPAAVQVLDIDVTEHGEPFLVMELLDGESLRERALRLGGVALPELLAHVDTLLEVLRAAHGAGIVHRDIKPDNLFVTRDGRLKVLDFGIARMRQGGAGLKTRTGAVLGTTSYMAPEQILGRDVDGRTDLYAVGATMFTLLTSRRLHDALTEGELLVKMSTTPAPPLAAVAPGVDPRVARVVDRALAFAIEQRYPDAQTMLADVRAVRRGEEPPFATAAMADGDERTRVHGRSIPDGPPLGAPLPGASPPAMAMPAAPVAAPAVPAAPAPPGPFQAGARATPGPRAPGSPPQLAIVVGAAVVLFCVGLGAALLLWRSRDQGAGDAPEGGAPTSVSLKDVPRAASSVAPATDAGGCQPGVPCTCAPGTPGNVPKSCQLTCGEAPGCQPSCSDRDVCESRCAGGCRSSCDHSKACDTRCTDNCAVDCRHVETCQATCGAGCKYTCENAGKCVPVVGEGSVVTCNQVGLCEVTCTGSCAVKCSATGQGCPITCQGQGPAKRCADGRKACGDGCSLPQ